jgi:hypothetical protein
MHEAPLWHWVMVALGVEPTYHGYPFSDRIESGVRPLPRRFVEEFRDRVDVGASAVVGGPLKARSYPSNPREAPIERAEFIRWARTVGWDLPAEMREGEQVKPADSVEGTKRGRTLYRLVLGMAIRQYGYQPRGENRGIAQTIAQDLELAGLSLTDDTIRECLKAAMKDLSDKERAALQPKAKTPKK